jgi:hypothetical protein
MHCVGKIPVRSAAWLAAALALLVFPLTGWTDHGFNRGNWPFRPPERPAVPAPAPDGWAANPIDHFISGALGKRGLSPSRPADKRTLLRRVTFDLTGLPPTPEEVAAFLADNSPQAYERLVDRLLASPRFGERWARHWLDVVRFADTAGFRKDFLRPEMYRYRDYVIRAFNDDLPYDRFVRQQIAGDELEPEEPQAVVATGFLRLYPEDFTVSDFMKHRQDVLDDVTEVTGLTFLGLTLGCAKCHDHKFDPIEQTDFFRLQACFSAIVPRDDSCLASREELAAYQDQLAAWEAATADIRRRYEEIAGPLRQQAISDITLAYDPTTREAWLTPETQRTTQQRQLVALSTRYVLTVANKRVNRTTGEAKEKLVALQEELAKYDALKPQPLAAAISVCDGAGPVPETHVLDAGDYRKPEELVAPGFPEFLGREDGIVPSTVKTGGRRSALAMWLTLPDHPLTARVIVNRLWQHHFGQGIVATANDFGSMGDSALHPELLDWLACELVSQGWSLKSIHRLMVLSATYQQSSELDPQLPAHAAAQQKDPTNKLLWRARRTRLEGEVVRDALYAVSGQLDLASGGPSVYLRLPQSVLVSSRYAWEADPVEANLNRRSIFTAQTRNLRHPLLAAFDLPDAYLSCGVRLNTLTPTQCLALWNGDETAEQAAHWAGRLLDPTIDDSEFVRRAWLEAYSRSPTSEELTAARDFLSAQAERIYSEEIDIPTSSQPQPCPSCLEPHKAAAYVDLCHALLNSTEFLFVD